MRSSPPWMFPWAVTLLLPLACVSPAPGPGTTRDGGVIDAGSEGWTWLPVQGSRCARGSTAGIGLKRSGLDEDLFIFLQGGGACWNQGTCVPSVMRFGPICYYDTACLYSGAGGQQPSAVHVNEHDPYPADGGGHFPREVALLDSVRALDRTVPDNPFRDATFVFVPYCTGDLHAGDAERTYPYKVGYLEPVQSQKLHFAGASNMDAYLRELKARFPGAKRIWLTGSSAGGYGATFNLPRVRDAFPDAEVHLLADSAPFVQPVHWEDWREAWNLQLPAGCEDCDAGMPQVAKHLAQRFPDSRQGLLAYDSDQVLRWFFFAGTGPEAALNPPVGPYQAEFAALLAERAAHANADAFVLPGTAHVMWQGYGTALADGGTAPPFDSADGGTNLREWIHAWATGEGFGGP